MSCRTRSTATGEILEDRAVLQLRHASLLTSPVLILGGQDDPKHDQDRERDGGDAQDELVDRPVVSGDDHEDRHGQEWHAEPQDVGRREHRYGRFSARQMHHAGVHGRCSDRDVADRPAEVEERAVRIRRLLQEPRIREVGHQHR